MPPDSQKVNLRGGEDNDSFDAGTTLLLADNSTEKESNNKVKEDDPDYLINSLVDIDGGTGTDTLVVVGTEFNDSFVVTGK